MPDRYCSLLLLEEIYRVAVLACQAEAPITPLEALENIVDRLEGAGVLGLMEAGDSGVIYPGAGDDHTIH